VCRAGRRCPRPRARVHSRGRCARYRRSAARPRPAPGPAAYPAPGCGTVPRAGACAGPPDAARPTAGPGQPRRATAGSRRCVPGAGRGTWNGGRTWPEHRASRVPAAARPGRKTGRPCGRPVGKASASRADQAAASLSFFSGRTLTLTEAGLAANHCSSLVNGLMPLRFGLAGTLTAVTLNRPGRVKVPAPFLLMAPETASSTAASTALTSLATTPLVSDRCLIRADLPRTSFSGAAFFGAAFFGAAAFFTAVVFAALVAAFLAAGFLVVFAINFLFRSIGWWAERIGTANVGDARVAAKRKNAAKEQKMPTNGNREPYRGGQRVSGAPERRASLRSATFCPASCSRAARTISPSHPASASV